MEAQIQAALAEALASEGVTQPAAAPAPLETAPAEATAPAPVAAPAAAPAPAKDRTMNRLEQLAQKQAELRREQESIKPHLEMTKVFSQDETRALIAAKLSGDPLAVMKALGMQYDDVLKSISKEPGKPAAQGEEPAYVKQLREEVESTKRQLHDFIAPRRDQELLEGIKSVLPADKFELIRALGEEKRVRDEVIAYYNQFGTMPSPDFTESMQIAAEAVESDLRAQRDRFLGLTGGSKPVSVAPSPGPSVQPGSGAVSSPKTLTNNLTTAPQGAAPKPRTWQEQQEANIAEIARELSNG